MTASAIAVAVSGGMDSLYALATLRELGHHVLALHARMLPASREPAGYEAMLARLRSGCDALGVSLHVADCADAFDRLVVAPFLKSYASGRTPNPCAHCNATVKFGLFLDLARSLGAGRVATGHYVRLERTENGTAALYAGKDQAKDQSYFLSLVPLERLVHAVAPLAGVTKGEVRAYLASRGMEAPSPSESQEICFVPEDDYRAFLTAEARTRNIALPGPGPVLLPDGTCIATHNGLWRYTEGQRRGLGIAWSEPLYVLAKDFAANALIVGPALALAGGEVRAAGINCLVPFTDWPETVYIRTRYRQAVRPARVRFEADAAVFREEISTGPYAGGQIAVAYTPEPHPDGVRMRVLGGGVISG